MTLSRPHPESRLIRLDENLQLFSPLLRNRETPVGRSFGLPFFLSFFGFIFKWKRISTWSLHGWPHLTKKRPPKLYKENSELS